MVLLLYSSLYLQFTLEWLTADCEEEGNCSSNSEAMVFKNKKGGLLPLGEGSFKYVDILFKSDSSNFPLMLAEREGLGFSGQ